MKNRCKLSIIFLIGLLFLTACVSPNTKSTEKDATSITTTIKGGRTGGAWAIFSEGIAESIRRENDGSYITVEPGSIIENPLLVNTGRVPYGLSYAMTSYAAYSGKEPYSSAHEDIRAVSVVVPANYYQIFIREELAFDSMEEMIASEEPLRLSVNQKGSAGELITREILNYYGVTYEDIISRGGSINHLSGSKAFEMLADNRIDAAGNAESAPSSNILEASTTTDLKMLTLDQETIQAVSEALGMESKVIPADTYDFLDEDVETVSTPAILIVNKNVSEQEVYAVTESIYNSLNYLSTVHEEFKALTGENMMQVGEVPLHPGAERFFKENGMLD